MTSRVQRIEGSMSRVMHLRGSILTCVPVLLFLAIAITSLAITPRTAHAIRNQELDSSGDGSGYCGLPGYGDDDQPTIAPPPGRRSTVQMSAPVPQPTGSGTLKRNTNLGTVRRFFVSGREFLRRILTSAR